MEVHKVGFINAGVDTCSHDLFEAVVSADQGHELRTAIVEYTHGKHPLLDQASKIEALSRLNTELNAGVRAHALFDYCSESRQRNVCGIIETKSTGGLSDNFLEAVLDAKGVLRGRKSYDEFYRKIIEPSFPDRPKLVGKKNEWKLIMDNRANNRMSFPYYSEFHDIGLGSNAAFLILISLAQNIRGNGLAQQLIHNALAFHRREGRRYAFAFGRLAQLSERYAGLTPAEVEPYLQSYLLEQRPDGLHPDFGVRLHQRAGAHIICALPYCANDPESLYHGFFCIYDLQSR